MVRNVHLSLSLNDSGNRPSIVDLTISSLRRAALPSYDDDNAKTLVIVLCWAEEPLCGMSEQLNHTMRPFSECERRKVESGISMVNVKVFDISSPRAFILIVGRSTSATKPRADSALRPCLRSNIQISGNKSKRPACPSAASV